VRHEGAPYAPPIRNAWLTPPSPTDHEDGRKMKRRRKEDVPIHPSSPH
jgi:hypothetical protein